MALRLANEIGWTLRQSLRSKILLLAASLSIFTAATMGLTTSIRTENLVREFAEENIAHETRLIAQQVEATFAQLQNDAFVIARTPPIVGLIRSQGNGGLDPVDGSSSESWRARLETIFAAIIEEREGYTQIRYIGVADGGRELVRVNRNNDVVSPVPVEQLQAKGQEPYFQSALALGRNETYLSDVTYNRENGQVQSDFIPTIRSVVPVFEDDGTLFGMIVINADYEALLRNFLLGTQLQREVVISNQAGDYIVRHLDGSVEDLQFHNSPAYEPLSFLSEAQDPNVTEWMRESSPALTYSVRLPIERNTDGAQLVVSTSADGETVYGPSQRTFWEGLGLTFLILIMVLVVALYTANRILFPLTRMTRDIELAKDDGVEVSLPINRQDEIGKLANAFHALVQTRKEYGARVKAVIDNVVDGIISVDSYGKIQAFNPAATTIFGQAASEAIGMNVADLMPSAFADDTHDYLSIYRETGDTDFFAGTREIEALRKDGAQIPVELSVSRISLDDGSEIFTCVIRDITERRRIATIQNEFVSTVNHELRTPLTSIRASLGMLQHRTRGTVDGKSEKLIDLSLQGCERLSLLVDDILDLEKIAAGRMNFFLEECEIGRLCEDIVERHLSLAEYHQVRFELKNRLRGPITCRLDSSRFNQALVNLLSNAAKFSPRGERVVIELGCSDQGTVEISVTDKGPGIPSSFRDKIFQRFAQADSSSSRAVQGSGLGLSITKSIIEAFDGNIDFESREGAGSKFVITLPIAKSPAQQEGDQCRAA